MGTREVTTTRHVRTLLADKSQQAYNMVRMLLAAYREKNKVGKAISVAGDTVYTDEDGKRYLLRIEVVREIETKTKPEETPHD